MEKVILDLGCCVESLKRFSTLKGTDLAVKT